MSGEFLLQLLSFWLTMVSGVLNGPGNKGLACH